MLAIQFNPDQMSREYGTNIYITKGDTTNRIQYRTSVVYAGDFMDDCSIFHLHKHQLYINKQEPDDHPYRLAAACSKVFYPIVLGCNAQGRLLFVRSDLIRERWRTMKPNIEREFGGEPAVKYINATERAINSPKVLDVVFRDLFFYNFFALRYGAYDSTQQMDVELPLIPFENMLKAKCTQNVVMVGQDLEVTQQGSIIDEHVYSYAELLRQFGNEGSGKVLGEYKIVYGLNQDHLIDSISADYQLNKEDKSLLMSIKMQSYHLAEYPLTATRDRDTEALGKELVKQAKKREKNSVWDKFFGD